MPGLPAIGFIMWRNSPLSSSRIAWQCAAIRAYSSLGVVNGSSAALEWQEFVAFMHARVSSMAVRVRLFFHSAAMSERPLVCVWSFKICARRSAPNTSRMPTAQILRQTRARARYSMSNPQSRKNESRGPKAFTSMPRSLNNSTYAKPLLSVYAACCTGVAPASAMW